MRTLRSRRGQIAIPAMLIFPSLFLFIYLIYETAKLSREKIRHQFAMDAAAFVEMTNYSDFLNRTAYVNGAFPMRIFNEGYGNFNAECDGKTNSCSSSPVFYADMLYANGAYPRSKSNKDHYSGDDASWDIGYCETAKGPFLCAPSAAAKNGSPPVMPPTFTLFIDKNADEYWHPYDLATEIFKLWVQVYSLLGSVEDAQLSVLKRLTKDGNPPHSFMAKSYWLNTGDPIASAVPLTQAFDRQMSSFKATPICQQKLDYWGNVHITTPGIQPYQPNHTDPDVDLSDPNYVTQPNICGSNGLFQLMWVDQGIINTLTKGGGIPLSMHWAIPPKNFFGVDFVSMINQRYPQGSLHTTISLEGVRTNSPSIWPNPTPKFQVRQYP